VAWRVYSSRSGPSPDGLITMIALDILHTVELRVLRTCNTALSGSAYSEAVGGSR